MVCKKRESKEILGNNMMQEKKKRYDNLDGLRTYAAIGIILMHVLSNGNYQLEGYLFERIIPSFADLVFLFMVISGFSMCCGYLEKMKKGQITLEDFYKKRYIKILPFFTVLIFLDIIISPSLSSLYEAFSSLTLCFGLLPNANHTVIGVSWTLGVIFVFYLLFPFFCFLLANRKRAWITWVICLIYNYLCTSYYFDMNHMVSSYSARSSFIYCAVYFVSGAMLYLYREEIERTKNLLWLIIGGLMIVAYYNGSTVISEIGLSVALVASAISKKNGSIILNNKATKVVSSISLEVYLCHMVIYRLLEKMKIIHVFGEPIYDYMLTSILTVVGAIIFALVVRWGINIFVKFFAKKKVV